MDRLLWLCAGIGAVVVLGLSVVGGYTAYETARIGWLNRQRGVFAVMGAARNDYQEAAASAGIK